jgi:hypothetical protein
MTAAHRANPFSRPYRPRSRAAVAAWVFLALVQLLVAAVVPFTERAPTRIGAHVEQPSERRHYVHNEDYCSACIARHLTGAASHASTPAFDAPRLAVFTPAAPLVAPDVERRGPLAARAPPSPVRLG